MLQSLMSTQDSESFSHGDRIAFSPFEVREDHDGHPMQSQCQFHVELHQGDNDVAHLRDPDLTAHFLTNKSMNRLVQVFGMEWSGEKPEMHERCNPWTVCCFLEQISSDPISTTKELKAFMEKYSLTRFIPFDEQKTAAEIRNELCQLLSCIQPMRLAVYDGQHREAVAGYASIGYWHPGSRAELGEEAWQETFEGAKEKGFPFNAPDRDESTFQHNTSVSVRIGGAKNKQMDYPTATREIQKYAISQETAQRTNVTTDLLSIAYEFITAENSGITVDHTFDSFWSRPTRKQFNATNAKLMTQVGTGFTDYVERRQLGSVCASKNKEFNANAIIEALRTGDGVSLMMTNGRSSIADTSTETAAVLFAMKFLMPTAKGRRAWKEFLARKRPARENNKVPPEEIAAARSSGFFAEAFVSKLVQVVEHLREKIRFERALLRALEIRDIEEAPIPDNENSVIDLTNWSVYEEMKKCKNQTQLDSKVGGKNFLTNQSTRFNLAITMEVVADFFSTIVELGIDPALDTNKVLDNEENQTHGKGKGKKLQNTTLRLYLL